MVLNTMIENEYKILLVLLSSFLDHGCGLKYMWKEIEILGSISF